MAKKLTLSENADIYKKREYQTEREKLKSLKGVKKLEYLWSYYHTPALLIILGGLLISYIIFVMLGPKDEYVMRCAIIDNRYSDELLTEIHDEFTPLLELEDERQKVYFDTMYQFNADPTLAPEVRQAFVTFIYANELDCVIAPTNELKDYSSGGLLFDLTEILPTDLLTALSDSLLYYDGENANMQVFGIDLEGTVLSPSKVTTTSKYYVSIPVTTEHKENAIKFIRYLYNVPE